MLDLELIKENENILTIGVPLRWRLLNFGIGSIFLAGMFIERTIHPFPLLLALAAFLSGCYVDTWSFDIRQKQVIKSQGLMVFRKKTFFQLEDVVKIELRNSKSPFFGADTVPDISDALSEQSPAYLPKPRKRGKGLSGLFLVFTDGKEINMHTTSIGKAYEQSVLGHEVSRFCNKVFSAKYHR